MGIFNFLKKKKKDTKGSSEEQKVVDEPREIDLEEEKADSKTNYGQMMKDVDTSGLSFKEKASLKVFQKMPKKKQQKIMQKAMNPQEVHKNKDKILKQVDDMVESGQIDKSQAEAVKSKLGLR